MAVFWRLSHCGCWLDPTPDPGHGEELMLQRARFRTSPADGPEARPYRRGLSCMESMECIVLDVMPKT